MIFVRAWLYLETHPGWWIPILISMVLPVEWVTRRELRQECHAAMLAVRTPPQLVLAKQTCHELRRMDLGAMFVHDEASWK